MEKVSTIINDALQELLIQASEAPIEAAEAQTAIRYLNRLMARLDAQGISLGYTIVSNLGDYVTVPYGAIDGIVKNLAISLAKQYGVIVTADLALEAKDALDAMRMLSVYVAPSSYGDTLPIGSGNEGDQLYESHFYPADATLIANETGGTIATETDTEV